MRISKRRGVYFVRKKSKHKDEGKWTSGKQYHIKGLYTRLRESDVDLNTLPKKIRKPLREYLVTKELQSRKALVRKVALAIQHYKFNLESKI